MMIATTPKQETASRHGMVIPAAIAGAVGMLLALLVAKAFRTHLLGDQAWCLYAAQRLLAGAQLYGPELTETNPPLILWFSSLPVVMGEWLHLSASFALKLLVFMMAIGSTWWCERILSTTLFKRHTAALLLLTYAILFIETGTPSNEFGQREHLLVILFLPYLLLAASDAAAQFASSRSGAVQFRDSGRIAIGIAAGVGICIKPQHALAFIGLESVLAVYTRSCRRALRPEFVALLLTGCAYLLLVRIAAPLYFSEIPLLVDTYWAFGEHSVLSLATEWSLFNVLFAPTLLGYVLCRRRLRAPTLPLALLVCGCMASVAYDLQHCGFDYQRIPARAFLLLAIGCLLIDLLPTPVQKLLRTPDLRISVAICALFFILSVPLASLFWRHHNLKLTPGPVAKALAQYPPGTPVYFMSTSLHGAFPAVLEKQLQWGSRFVHLWMLPAIVQNQLGHRGSSPFKMLKPETVARLAALQHSQTTEDFRRWKPVIVIVPRCDYSPECPGLSDYNFDLLGWFLQNPAFAAEWSHYQLQTSEENLSIYARSH